MKTEENNTDLRLIDPLRIALVAERFWPFSGPTELQLGELATELKRQGHAVQILTSKLEKSWPGLLDYREIPVNRIARISGGPWATFRYARRFGKYFCETERVDAILVFGFSIVTHAILRSVGQELPVVVFVNRSLLGVDSVQQIPRRYISGLSRCRAVVTDCQSLAEDLSELDDMPPVQVIATGAAATMQPPSLSSQSAARAALSEAHPILGVDAGRPLAITSLTDNNDDGILDAIRAWSTVIENYPKAKLWIVGDGKMAARAWQEIVDLNLIQSVVMPGFFDDDAGLLLAADLYIHSYRTHRADPGVVRAMAKQRCILATANRWTEGFIEPDENGLLAPSGNPSALAEAIQLAFSKPELRSRLASRGVKTAELQFSLPRQVDLILKLLQLPADQPCESTL
ncbi:MAG: glycosyltransferase family 4 protein [Mariniblastus sp.]|nr:glycosyltransferase family 4 protein [Mariniblastus sp.]